MNIGDAVDVTEWMDLSGRCRWRHGHVAAIHDTHVVVDLDDYPTDAPYLGNRQLKRAKRWVRVVTPSERMVVHNL